MSPLVKICGLTTRQAVEAARDADYVGFIFYPQSPRHVTPQKAAELAGYTDRNTVAVTVDADDTLLSEIKTLLRPAHFQLHGKESNGRIREVKEKFGLPVIKAIGIAAAEDIAKAQLYPDADMLMFDAKPAGGLPGGNGVAFDWTLLAGLRLSHPWFLSGGITPGNVEEALRVTGAKMVDVSSSLEAAPGVKDATKVREFIEKVKSL